MKQKPLVELSVVEQSMYTEPLQQAAGGGGEEGGVRNPGATEGAPAASPSRLQDVAGGEGGAAVKMTVVEHS